MAEPFTPPNGNAVLLYFDTVYAPPIGNLIIFGEASVDQIPMRPDFNIPWGRPPITDAGKSGGWKQTNFLSANFTQKMDRAQRIENGRRSRWSRPELADRQIRATWQSSYAIEGCIKSPWSNSNAKDAKTRLPWNRQGVLGGNGFALPYLHPPRMYELWHMPFDAPRPLEISAFDVPWGNPPPKDRFHETKWGRKYYEEICKRKYEPPKGGQISLNHTARISHVGDEGHIWFYFDELSYDRRCNQREPSGWRDAYFYTPPKPIPTGIKKGYYYVLNTALLTRVSDRKPIDILGFTISTNVDSWCWNISAMVKSKEALETAFPSGVMADIEAAINGHKWILQAERWTKGEAFAGKAGNKTINGRSLSANLAQPFGPSISIAETNDRTAEQLAQLALDEAALAGVSGWAINWGDFIDWLVPGGAWAVAEKTPIEIIQEIVRAGHGFIQTHQQTKTILVKPRYKLMPWLWASATPDVIIPKSMIISVDTDYEQKVQYNAAFVSGSNNNGISAKVTRAGTAGDVTPPIFTSPLITDTDAALAKGSGMIAESGSWETGRITFQLMPLNTPPGLILPGTMIRVEPESGSPWMCQAIGTTINANRTRGNGVVVRQTVDIEIYHGA